MKISVIGCGRWGSFLARYLSQISHDVTLYGRQDSAHYTSLVLYRRNGYITLPNDVNLTSNLVEACNSEVIVIAIASQELRSLCQEMQTIGLRDKIIVLCMKGLEEDTGLRLSQIVKDVCDRSNQVAVWLGPGHVEDFMNDIPSCMVIDSEDEYVKRLLVERFSSNLIRFYYGTDLIGNELGAALKNVIGIAAGILDGLDMSSLKGALMARGTREVARLIVAAGGKEASAYGLCHLGDYEATLFSCHSRNREFGQSLVLQNQFSGLAEGSHAVYAVMELCKLYNIEMPICESVYEIIYHHADAKKSLEKLFNRKRVNEFVCAQANIKGDSDE